MFITSWLYIKYSKTCLKGSLKRRPKNIYFKTVNHLMQVKSIAECYSGVFCNTFDPH